MVRVIFILVLVTVSVSSRSQNNLFESHQPIRIDIVTNLRELFKDINPEKAKYHQGFISYLDSNGNPVIVNTKFKTRGIFRRSRENCNLPPLSIKFVDKQLDSTIFAGIDKIKLVNTCNKNRQNFLQFLYKEYLAYRIYNILTEYSFKVRVVKLVYIDINNSMPPFETGGFLIEELDALNQRKGTKTLKTQGIVQEATMRSKMDITSVFQYMIGNTDWSVPKQHNIKLVINDSTLTPIAIPYDFDFCGFVNPPYTKPPDIIPIKHVTDRYYRGFCRKPNELQPTLDLFNIKKDSIYSLLINDTLLNKKHKAAVIEYLNDFYSTINNPKQVKNEFIDNCRTE